MNHNAQNRPIRHIAIVLYLVLLCMLMSACAPSPAITDAVNDMIADELSAIADELSANMTFVPMSAEEPEISIDESDELSDEGSDTNDDLENDDSGFGDITDTTDYTSAESDFLDETDNITSTDTYTDTQDKNSDTNAYAQAYNTENKTDTNTETDTSSTDTNANDNTVNDTNVDNTSNDENNTNNNNGDANNGTSDNANDDTNDDASTGANNTTDNTTSTAATTQMDTYTSGSFPLYCYSDYAYLGRARIPSVGVNVAIYNTLAQSVCDAYDSACFSYIYTNQVEGHYTIAFADHQNQGFSAIKNCTIGSILYIDGIDGHTYKYTCDWIDYNGHNDTLHLYNSSWNICDNVGGICAYTCNITASNVTIVHFSAV